MAVGLQREINVVGAVSADLSWSFRTLAVLDANATKTMPTSAQIEDRIRSLDDEIAKLGNAQAKFRRDRNAISSQIARLNTSRYWWQFVVWFRSPMAKNDLWPVDVMICGPAIVGAALFITSHLVTNSLLTAFACGGCGVVVGTAIFSVILFCQKTESLQEAFGRINTELPRLRNRHEDLSLHYREIVARLTTLRNERHQLASSVQYQHQCERLLRENWKAMRGVEWENYLCRVFSALGFTVETTKTSGDQGVDLVVQRGQSRLAVQAKGYANSLGNSAVQQVVAGMNMYHCNGCAVITNSRFTQSAIQLAAANGCIMISESSFEDFVLGRLAFWNGGHTPVAS